MKEGVKPTSKIINNLYKMFIHESGKVSTYDKYFFIVWETHKDEDTRNFIDKYVNNDYLNEKYQKQYCLIKFLGEHI